MRVLEAHSGECRKNIVKSVVGNTMESIEGMRLLEEYNKSV